MRYELWHLMSRNLLEEFETESEALAAVREYVEADEPAMVQELAVSAVPTDAGDVHTALPPTLAGDALAERTGIGTRR